MEKILIVEDNKYLRFTLSVLLEQNGFIPLTAEDKHCAITEIGSEKPDLILMDKKLPDCDGIEFLREIRKNNNMLPVIMISAYSEDANAERAMDAGAFAFITKPFENREIIDTINRALHNNKK